MYTSSTTYVQICKRNFAFQQQNKEAKSPSPETGKTAISPSTAGQHQNISLQNADAAQPAHSPPQHEDGHAPLPQAWPVTP